MLRVKCLGCRVGNYQCRGVVEAHHLIGLEYRGGSQKASDYETIGLCEAHHNGGIHAASIHGITLHAGVQTWEKNFNTQEFHLDVTRIALNLAFPDWCPMTGQRRYL